MKRRFPQALRWGVCLAVALGLHTAGAAVLLARWNDDADRVANAPVIMIDLAPVAVAPDTKPSEVPPDQVASKPQVDPDPQPEKPPEPEEVTPPPEPEPEKPVEKVELPPDPAPLPDLTATLPPPKPVEEAKPEPKKEEKKDVKKKPRHKRTTLASAPSAADKKAERAAAPAPGASSRNSNALPSWTSQLVSRLERYKRYPSEAQSRHETGVVKLAFSVDRSGGVHHARIVGSSGSSLLDRETLSLLNRAAPLPAPPAELTGSQIAVVVPIRYNIR